MLENFATRLAAVDSTMLTPLIQQALKQPNAAVRDWSYQVVHGGFGHEASGVYGVYRFHGTANAGRTILPWSLILKASGRALSSDEPTAPNYWKREALIYQSDLCVTLPDCLTMPRCYAVVEPTTEEVWLWLENVRETTDRIWPLVRYSVTAQHLGRFNGAYLARRPLPVYPWLMEGYWSTLLHESAPYLSDLYAWRDPPLVQQIMPANVLPHVANLCERREALVEALAQQPRCFCHHDAHRRNFLARRTAAGAEQTVAIDWALSGVGALGVEAAKLLTTSLQFLEYPVAQAVALDKTIFAGYLTGLQVAGWQGDPQIVRRGYTLAVSLMGLEMLWRDLVGIHEGAPVAIVERIFGHPLPRILEQHAGLLRFTLDLADEALALLSTQATQGVYR